MRSHIDALVLMLRVWAIYGLLTAAALGVLAVGTTAATGRTDPADAAQGTVSLLAACAVALGAGGAAGWHAARGLQLRRTRGRWTALAVAVANLLVVPFGTAIGVYTFWVLLNDDARREFGRPPRARVS